MHHRLHIVGFDLQSDKPASSFAGNSGALERASEPCRLTHFHPADHRQFDAVTVRTESPSLIGSAKAGAIILALEAWVATALLKERSKCGAQIDDRLLHHSLRDIIHPRKLCPFYRIKLTAQRNFARLLACLVLLLPLSQRPVPGEARSPGRTREIETLRGIGVERFYERAALRALETTLARIFGFW